MLVPFTVDPKCLDTVSVTASVYSAHIQLMKLWRHYGALILAGSPDRATDVFARVEKLPQKIRTLWQESLKTLPLEKSASWTGRVAELRGAPLEALPCNIEVAFVDDECAAKDGLIKLLKGRFVDRSPTLAGAVAI